MTRLANQPRRPITGFLKAFWEAVPAELVLILAAALAIGMPWFLVSWQLHPKEFWHDMVLVNHVHRFLKPEHPTQTGHWFSHLLNVPILFIFFFPWSMFVPQSLRDGFCRLRQEVSSRTAVVSSSLVVRDEHGLVLVWGYAAVVFAFFSISKTILVTYIFPMYPALAIIVAAWFCRMSDRPISQDSGPADVTAPAAAQETDIGPPPAGVQRGLAAGAAFGLFLLVGLLVSAGQKFPEALVAAGLLGMVATAVFAVPLLWGRRHPLSPADVPLWIAAGMVPFALVLVWVVIPAAAPRVCVQDLVEAVPNPERAHLIAYRLDRPTRPMITTPSLGYYFRGRWSLARTSEELEAAHAATNDPTFVLCRDGKAVPLIASGARALKRQGGFTLVELGAGAAADGDGDGNGGSSSGSAEAAR